MFLSSLSYIFPVITSMLLALFGFHSYYASSPVFLWALCIASGIITLLLILPVKPVHRAFFVLTGALVVINITYNFIVSALVASLILIISAIFPLKRSKSRILFTPDSQPVKVTYRPTGHIKRYFSRVSVATFTVSILLFALTFSTTSQGIIWGVRAFPINLSEKVLYNANAVPSGKVTCSVGYDSAAIYVDAFTLVVTDNGTVPSPAQIAGMKEGDVIVKINNQHAKYSDFITKGPDGSEALFEILRLSDSEEAESIVLKITPAYSITDNKYMIGILYYESLLPGIYQTLQTVSFFYPDTGHFAATAHSSEIQDSSEYYTYILKSAAVEGRDDMGLVASPGEILGEILTTNRFGAFGVWNETGGKALPIAKKHEFTLGKATLLSNFEGGEVIPYEVYITGTYRIDDRDVICLVASDEKLQAAGGVTRGMSGSPIIQHGKIIGALSNTDSEGYCAYATFAYDMAHELYLSHETISQKEEMTQ